jgi:hypothetical protein
MTAKKQPEAPTAESMTDPRGALDIAKVLAFLQMLLSLFNKQPAMAAAGSHDPQACFLEVAKLQADALAKALEHAQHHAPGE